MYKLIAIDMDGTLLNSDGEISSENLRAIREAVDRGVKVVITTGRGIQGIEKVIDKIGFNIREEFVIANNGVTLYTTNTKKLVKSFCLSNEQVKEIYNFGIENDVYMHFYNKDGCIILKENEFSEFEKNYIGMPVFLKPDFYEKIDEFSDIFKVLYMSNSEKIDKLSQVIPRAILDNYSVVRSLSHTIEVFSKNCNKGIAIKSLAEMLKLDRNEVMALGDQQNDFEMIKFAGLGIAMGNAVEEIKSIAKHITDTNDNDGVAKAIDRFVLNK